MIDIESDIVNDVRNEVKKEFPNAAVVSVYDRKSSVFPLVHIEEKDNYVYEKGMTSCQTENFAQVMYEIACYSNALNLKKTECRKLAALVDRIMTNKGFIRIMLQPVPNLSDATVYKIVSRYKAVVSRDKTIYRR